MVKNLIASAGDLRDRGSIVGQEEPLEEAMASHSSILACEIMDSLGLGLQRVRQD